TTSYTHTGLSRSTTYYYTVIAYDTVGNTSSQAPWVYATTAAGTTIPDMAVSDTLAPSMPTGLVGSAGPSMATLQWSASTDNLGVAGYKVYIWKNATWTFLKSVTPTSTSDSPLAAGSTYYYCVTAYDQAGNESPKSGWVSVIPLAGTGDMAAPVDLA